MAEARIPAKQLVYRGTYEELFANLLDRETGWCIDDNIIYIKDEENLTPLSQIAIINTDSTYDTVRSYVSRGIVPVMMDSGTENAQYLYLQSISTSGALFGAIYKDRYRWAEWNDATETWVFGNIEDVPHDGNAYLRKDGQWTSILDLADASQSEIINGEIAIGILPAVSGTVIIAGKEYRTVVIGNQEWLAENLNTELGILGQDCFMYNNDPEMRGKYGLLYPWTTLCTGNGQPSSALSAILPDGWRLPSETDFSNLIEFAGGGEAAGAKLKSSSSDWTSSGGGSDDFGFSALPGGWWNNGFFSAGQAAYYWTATQDEAPFASMVYITTGPGCYYDYYRTNRAYSVRLVKDHTPGSPRTAKVKVPDLVKAATDPVVSATSESPVQSKAVYSALESSITVMRSYISANYQPKGNYLTEEADPVFSASPAHQITNENIAAWNAKQDAIVEMTGEEVSTLLGGLT